MYDACRYQKAWSVTELSPWCAVFSKEELRILEYREDLDYYYKAGYGRDINTRLGCPLLHDMMRHFWYCNITSLVSYTQLIIRILFKILFNYKNSVLKFLISRLFTLPDVSPIITSFLNVLILIFILKFPHIRKSTRFLINVLLFEVNVSKKTIFFSILEIKIRGIKSEDYKLIKGGKCPLPKKHIKSILTSWKTKFLDTKFDCLLTLRIKIK